jgi:hypothetical protein
MTSRQRAQSYANTSEASGRRHQSPVQTKEDFQVDFSRIDKMLEKWT